MSTLTDLLTYFECPITREPMQDPYRALPCGHSFEREAIAAWMSRGNRTCPLDRGRIEELVSNVALKELIIQVHTLMQAGGGSLDHSALKDQIILARSQPSSAFLQKKLEKEQKIQESFVEQRAIGFYLLGTCRKQQCSLFEQVVWINKNTGNFDANRECNFTQCSSCEEDFEDINTIAIHAFEYSWTGKKVTGEMEQRRTRGEQASRLIFADLSQWHYLHITVSPS